MTPTFRAAPDVVAGQPKEDEVLTYELSAEDRQMLAPHHRKVQAAIAVLAAAKLGLPCPAPAGICKLEGGVKVGERQIAIMRSGVLDHWAKPSLTFTAEECAVVSAIHDVAKMVRAEGFASLDQFGEVADGDPLRSMLTYA